jgi:hypothetical protein
MKTKKYSGRVVVALLACVAAGIMLTGISYYFYCPCERTPGGWLLGDEITEPVQDWSFANDVGLCQVQVSAVLPHSVNLNCMSSNGRLYLSCSRCDGKYWSTAAVESSVARIRVDESVYPVKITRVLDPVVLDEAWVARATKLGRPLDSPRPEHWWSFNLVSR